jgi:hypothetical protein
MILENIRIFIPYFFTPSHFQLFVLYLIQYNYDGAALITYDENAERKTVRRIENGKAKPLEFKVSLYLLFLS